MGMVMSWDMRFSRILRWSLAGRFSIKEGGVDMVGAQIAGLVAALCGRGF
jgi:hypothetical protein